MAINKKMYKFIINKLKNDKLSEFSSQCSYYTILSVIPLLLFFMTLVKFINIDKEKIFLIISSMFPFRLEQYIFNVIDEIYNRSFSTISFSMIVALWSSSKGLYYLSEGIRKIYKCSINKKNKYCLLNRIEGIAYTVLFVFILVLLIVLLLFGDYISNFFIENNVIFYITISVIKLRPLILMLIMFFYCLLLYTFIPKNFNKFKNQIVGSIFASFFIYIFTWCFSLYINAFDSFSNMYGNLSNIIIFFLWIYICIYIILIGAEINYFLQSKL